ncbi:MAG: B12-binding domain-containing radical SAM protein [Candidatus Omnitrophica bacterium]|nr:B12-binding domain-containing radical SAM protein [Candidatus Omnitrophota bacterium]
MSILRGALQPHFKVLFVYPNLYMMNMMPPSIAIFSALLKQKGIEVALFDTTYYPWDHVGMAMAKLGGQGIGRFEISSDKRKELTLQVRPFNLVERGITPKETDMVDDFLQLVDTFQPDLIAVSAVEDTYFQGLYLLNQIKDRKIPTILGGVFATFAPHIAIEESAIDMVCVGEGEGALVELCERMAMGLDYSDVNNLWVKGPDGKAKVNPQRPLVELDTLPILDFEIFEENRIYRPMAGTVYRMIPIETHRGCPFTCTYCNSPSQNRLHKENRVGKFFRKKSITKVQEELVELVRRWKAEYVYFPADTFLAWSNEEFKAFIEMYRNVRLPFWMQTRPETITEEAVDMLKSVGCHRVSLGIEHGNEQFRREVVDRQIANEELIKRTNLIGRHIPVSVNNITGFPTETRELAFDTIRLNRELIVDTMNCYTFMPYHGTPLRTLAVTLGLLDDNAVTCSLTAASILKMPQYSPREITGIARCFSLYARLPESLWPTIRRAEIDDEEGNAVFADLREQYIANYFNDGKVTFS